MTAKEVKMTLLLYIQIHYSLLKDHRVLKYPHHHLVKVVKDDQVPEKDSVM